MRSWSSRIKYLLLSSGSPRCSRTGSLASSTSEKDEKGEKGEKGKEARRQKHGTWGGMGGKEMLIPSREDERCEPTPSLVRLGPSEEGL